MKNRLQNVTVEQIIDGCRTGDSDSRRELYERYAKPMYGVVRRYVSDPPAAEDVLHDGFVTLFTKIGDFRAEGAFEGWCRRIFVNAALSYLRRNSTRAFDSLPDGGPPPKGVATDYGVVEQLSADDIMRCMERLPEGYRTVLNMHAVEGYSYQEIAALLNVSEPTVRSQYVRARNKLAEMMKTIYGTGEI